MEKAKSFLAKVTQLLHKELNQPRNYSLNMNGKFCAGTQVSKIIALSKKRRPCGIIEKVHRFFWYVCNHKFVVYWVLRCGTTCKWVLFLLACIDHWSIYNRLVIACTVKTVAGVKFSCSTLEKASLSLGIFVFNRLRLSACTVSSSKI